MWPSTLATSPVPTSRTRSRTGRRIPSHRTHAIDWAIVVAKKTPRKRGVQTEKNPDFLGFSRLMGETNSDLNLVYQLSFSLLNEKYKIVIRRGSARSRRSGDLSNFNNQDLLPPWRMAGNRKPETGNQIDALAASSQHKPDIAEASARLRIRQLARSRIPLFAKANRPALFKVGLYTGHDLGIELSQFCLLPKNT